MNGSNDGLARERMREAEQRARDADLVRLASRSAARRRRNRVVERLLHVHRAHHQS